MSNLLPPVVAELRASITDFAAKMAEARKETAKTEEEGSSHFKAMGAALAGVGAGAAVLGFAKSATGAFEDVASATAKMQRLTGGTAEDMSRLLFEAKETGINADSFTTSIVKMSKAADGSSKKFDEAGIATRDMSGHLLSTQAILENAAQVFSTMPDGVEKTALAVKLFGKSGTDMLPMLNKGKEGLAELGKESDKFGLTIGQSGVDAMKKNVIAHRQMHAAVEGLKVQIGEKLMPVITAVSTWFAAHLPAAMEFARKIIDRLTPTFQTISKVIQEDVLPAIQRFVVWFQNDAMPVIQAVVEAIVHAFATAVQWIQAHWDQIKAVVATAIADVRQVIETTVGVIMSLWERFGGTITKFAEQTWNTVKELIKGAWEIISGVFDFFKDLLTGKWGKLWGDITHILGGVWDVIFGLVRHGLQEIGAIFALAWDAIGDGVKSGFGAVVSWFEGLPGLIWDTVKKIPGMWLDLGSSMVHALWDGLKAAWNWLADRATFNLPKIHIPMVGDIGGGTISLLPHLATGGTTRTPGLAVVGEKGPEVVALPAGATVYPHGGMPAGGGKTIHQTNNFYGIMDPAELARRQAFELAWALKTAS